MAFSIGMAGCFYNSVSTAVRQCKTNTAWLTNIPAIFWNNSHPLKGRLCTNIKNAKAILLRAYCGLVHHNCRCGSSRGWEYSWRDSCRLLLGICVATADTFTPLHKKNTITHTETKIFQVLFSQLRKRCHRQSFIWNNQQSNNTCHHWCLWDAYVWAQKSLQTMDWCCYLVVWYESLIASSYWHSCHLPF